MGSLEWYWYVLSNFILQYDFQTLIVVESGTDLDALMVPTSRSFMFS